jgi:hypothetical protein
VLSLGQLEGALAVQQHSQPAGQLLESTQRLCVNQVGAVNFGSGSTPASHLAEEQSIDHTATRA